MRSLKLSAIAALAFVGAYFLVRARIEDQSHADTSAAAAHAVVAPPNAASNVDSAQTSVNGATATPAASGGNAAAELQPSEPETERVAARPGMLASGGRGGRSRVLREQLGAAEPATLRAQVAGDLGPRGQPLRAANGSQLQAAASDDRDLPAAAADARSPTPRTGDVDPRGSQRARRGGTLAQPSAAQATAGSSGSPAATVGTKPLEVGDDLRSLRNNRKPRPLNLEDPFQ